MDNIKTRYNDMELPKAIQSYIKYEKGEKGHSPNTINNYVSDLVLFLRYTKKIRNNLKTDLENITFKAMNDPFFQSITTQDIKDFINYLVENDNAASSRARRISAIRMFFKYLKSNKIIKENVAEDIQTPKIPKRNPVYLELDESKNLLNTVKEYNGEFEERDYCMVTIFLNCGLRLEELVNINMDNIKGDILDVIGKGDKERLIPLNNACLTTIQNYLAVKPNVKEGNKEPLFVSKRGERISKRTVQQIVKKYLDKAGYDTKKYSTHKLRHSAATLMYKYGNVDIRALQEILGHESIATTQIYTHVDNVTKRNAVNSNPLADIL
jgi:site-specific recombinase XerD